MLLRDPVHGDIYLSECETDILDSAEMQRLRGIKQTGTGYLVYPGCLHTRFDHSLGTAFVAKRILNTLRHKGFTVDEYRQAIVTAAALVHDVGHIPFGHTLEDEAGLLPRHDRAARILHFLNDTDLAARLQRRGLLEPVRALLTGQPHPDIKPWMREIVMSTVDADMLDYLRRDAYFAGVSHRYDDRLFSYFTLDDDHLAVTLFKHGIERAETRTEMLSLLRIRYILTERIYLHHTKVIAGAMLAKGMARLLDAGLKEADLYRWQDADVFTALIRSGDPVAAAMADAVRRRRLLKRAYVLASGQIDAEQRRNLIERFAGPERAGARRALEQAIAAELGLSEAQVIVHCPERSMFKEVKVLAQTPHGPQPLDSLDRPIAHEVRGLARQYEDLWRFYVLTPQEAAARAREACRALLGIASTYQP